MRNYSFTLLSSVALAAATETGSAPIPAENAAIDIAAVKPVIEAEQAERKAKAERLAAKRKAAKPEASAKPEATPGKRKPKQAAAITEAKPDPRAAKAERIAVDRKAVSELYARFEANRDSIPVKPLSAFKPSSTTPHPIARNPSARQAAAIALAFAAAGKKLAAGTSVPRVFELNGSRVCIENGVLRDATSSGLCTVSGDTPETETIRLAAKADKAIIGLIGERAAKAGKLI